MRYNEPAPRLGLAYRLPKFGLVFRAGGGMFHDTALGSLINPVNFSPLNTWQFVPLSGTGPGYGSYVNQPPPPLSLPAVWEWKTSLERALGSRSMASLAYVGSDATRLLRLEGTVDPVTGILQQSYFASYGRSNYQALQAQIRGNLNSSFSTLVSYTWGHSIDNGSQGSALYVAKPDHAGTSDRGSSDFDSRQNLNASLSYRMAALPGHGWRKWSAGWVVSSSLSARSGFPFDLTRVDRSIGLGFVNTGRPDLVPGQPLWIHDANVPDGRVLNPNAFLPPASGLNGTLGRNVLTGPALFQTDASARRIFRLFERGAALETSVNAFNPVQSRQFC